MNILQKKFLDTLNKLKKREPLPTIYEIEREMISLFANEIKTEKDVKELFEKTNNVQFETVFSYLFMQKNTRNNIFDAVSKLSSNYNYKSKIPNLLVEVSKNLYDNGDLIEYIISKNIGFHSDMSTSDFLETNLDSLKTIIVNKLDLIKEKDKEEEKKDNLNNKMNIKYNLDSISNLVEKFLSVHTEEAFKKLWTSLNNEQQMYILKNIRLNENIYESIKKANNYSEKPSASFFKDYMEIVYSFNDDIKKEILLNSKLSGADYKKIKNNLFVVHSLKDILNQDGLQPIKEAIIAELDKLEIIHKKDTRVGVELLPLISKKTKKDLIIEENDISELLKLTGNTKVFYELYKMGKLKLNNELIEKIFPNEKRYNFVSNHNINLDLIMILKDKDNREEFVNEIKNISSENASKLLSNLISNSLNGIKEANLILDYFEDNTKFFRELIKNAGYKFQEFLVKNKNYQSTKNRYLLTRSMAVQELCEGIEKGKIKIEDLSTNNYPEDIFEELKSKLSPKNFQKFLSTKRIETMSERELQTILEGLSNNEIRDILVKQAKNEKKLFASAQMFKDIIKKSGNKQADLVKIIFNDEELVELANEKESIITDIYIKNFNETIYNVIKSNKIDFKDLKYFGLRNLSVDTPEYREIMQNKSIGDLLDNKKQNNQNKGQKNG